MYRTKFVTLKSEINNFEIYLRIFAGRCLSRYDNCSLRIGKKPYFGKTISGEFRFNFDTEGNFLDGRSSSLLHDSIEINGKIYYDVVDQEYIETVYDGVGGIFQMSRQLFYNKTYGVLQIIDGGENFLTINQ